MRNRWLAPAGLAAAALVVAACGSSSSSGGSGSGNSPAAHGSSNALGSGTVNGAKVLVNGKGLTLYWFALDTPNKSNCNGSCIQYWPPVPGPATAMAGVTGTIGVITRSNGSKQATWNGHPLYTYISDTAPGTAKGNGLNLSGGVWHDIVLSGHAAPAASPSSGGGGYGY